MRTAIPLLVLAFAAPAAASPKSDVASLGWIVGQWRETKAGITTTETWTIRADGSLSGVGETARAGRSARVEERMTITAETAGVTFTATLPGQAPVPFVRLPGPAGEAVFENKTHDFPQRIIYRHCDADLCARIEGQIDGKADSQDWRFVRVR